MAFSFNGSTQYISANSGAADGSTPLTLAVRFRPLSTVEETTTRVPIALSDNTNASRAVLLYRLQSAFHSWHSGQQSFKSGGMTINVWSSGVGLFTSLTSRQTYLDAVSGDTNTSSTTAVSANRTSIGAWFNSSTVSGYANDDIAEAAIWSAVLNADEVVSLNKGFKPTRIRPQSLVFYAPLIRDLNEVKGALALTNNNSATVADHPRVY